MKIIITITFITIISFCLSGQELKIQQGNRIKTFSPRSVYKMVLLDEYMKTDSCCNYIDIEGRISSVTNDSIKLKLTGYQHFMRDTTINTKINYRLASKDGGLDLTIAHQDINYLKHFKSAKSRKRKESLGPIGGILIIMSLGTMTSNFFIDKKSDREKVWKLAGGEFALGLTLAILSSSKKYNFKAKDGDNWAIIP